jgi:hypothetical protein
MEVLICRSRPELIEDLLRHFVSEFSALCTCHGQAFLQISQRKPGDISTAKHA